MSSLQVCPRIEQFVNSVASAIKKEKKQGRIVLMTGVGLRDDGIPLRFPAIAIPGLKLIQKLRENGHETHYVMYQATDFITKATKLNAEIAQQNAPAMQRYLANFINLVAPDTAPAVSLAFGAACQMPEAQLSALKQQFKMALAIATDLRQIKEFSGGNSAADPDLYLDYAAANVIGNCGLAHGIPNPPIFATPAVVPSPVDHLIPNDTKSLILLGGAKESAFFSLTKTMAKINGGDRYQVSSEILPIGQVPTYYRFKGSDLLTTATDVEIEGFVPDPKIANDFSALTRVMAPHGGLKALRALAHG